MHEFRTTVEAYERNQCDGCCSGAVLRGHLHIDKEGHAFMSCQRERYTNGPTVTYIVKAAGMHAYWQLDIVGGYWGENPETAHRFATNTDAQKFADSCSYECEVIESNPATVF